MRQQSKHQGSEKKDDHLIAKIRVNTMINFNFVKD